MKKSIILALIYVPLIVFLVNCKENGNEKEKPPFVWEGANIYFLLVDRFYNADTLNDVNFNRTKEPAVLRGFEGGDLKGITQKINEGYFTDLGVNAIWMTPIVEQIHGSTDEGTGLTYGYHGYWTKDWTAIDPNFGTKDDLHELVEAAHKKGIRVLLDAVINHTGPVTAKDPAWPQDWVRTGPKCEYTNYESTVSCTLVENLPDIRTESNEDVDLPQQLVEKWKKEGRYQQEMAELEAFFKRTGYPRAPRFYIIKWLTDYITEFGIDGYRCDTVKHTEAYVWEEFKTQCDDAFNKFKEDNPDKVLDNNDFYLVGEVYNYGISNGKYFDYGDKKQNYFDNKFNSQINFEFKWNAKQMPIQEMFAKYDSILHSDLKGFGVLNYLSSHDDHDPFDAKRERPFETANKLLLAPGTSQIYYGDETARKLYVEGAEGDAHLRSFMNWEDQNSKKEILKHWKKLGRFRNNHPAIGAGKHQMLSSSPFVFSRSFSTKSYQDKVVVGLNLPKGEKLIDVSSVFNNGEKLHDAYSNQNLKVKNGKVVIDSKFNIVLLEKYN